ncbi:unnamed protein product, partial [Closterium sp. NIES-53]
MSLVKAHATQLSTAPVRFFSEPLREKICRLLLSSHIERLKGSLLHFLAQPMPFDLHVLGESMQHHVLGYCNGTGVVTKQ